MSFTGTSEWEHLYVDGERRTPPDRDRIEVTSPQTGETVAHVPAGTAADVDDAFRAAVDAQSDWSRRLPQKRRDVVENAVDLLAEHHRDLSTLVLREAGGTRAKADFEIGTNAPGMMREAATFPLRMEGRRPPSTVDGRESVVRREPVGVVGVISPWNFPFHLSMRAVAPALAVGNAVVLKPSEETPISGGLVLAELFERAGLPPGVLNVVPGWGEEAGAAVAAHPDANVVSFTGSTAVGRRVARSAGENLSLAALELGGNNPHVVLDDADLEAAIDAAVFGSFFHQGQVCISINRHLVHEDVYDDYVDELATRVEQFAVGTDEDADVGPVINETQRDQMLDYVSESVDAGAEVVTGGGYEGLVVEPTVVRNATNEMPVSCNEHFGPIAPVIPFADDDEAVELANDTEYGLTASVHSTDVARATRLADGIDAGMVHVNDQTINGEPHVPFGGVKASGLGRYNGDAILREFTHERWVTVQHTPRDYPL